MKKIIVIAFTFLFLLGCTNIKKTTLDDLINEILTTNAKLSNQYRSGYKYYLPQDLQMIDKKDFNERFTGSFYTYYFYVDLVSYHNQVENAYEINKNAYYSKAIKYKDLYGYLEINKNDDKYLIEMMYNYAKIEVMVNEDDVNGVVVNSLLILSSIDYNKVIINNLMGENILNSNEKDFNIFETKKTEGNFIRYVEEYDNYEKDNKIPDLDLIK